MREPDHFVLRLARIIAIAVFLLHRPLYAQDARASIRASLASATETGEPRARAEALFRLAEFDDSVFAFARALEGYEAARALDPGSRHAPRAEARAAILRTHAEGDFAPFVRLETIRRDPALASDALAIDALVRDANAFPPGLVRVETWVLAAEAYARRLGRPGEAPPLLRRVLEDPRTEGTVAAKAARDLVDLHLSNGDLAGAKDAVRLASTRADRKLARDVARVARRRYVHSASLGTIVLTCALALRAWAGAWRRGVSAAVARSLKRSAPLALAYAAYVAMGGALLASGYEAGHARPFLLFGAALAGVLLVARAWGAAGSARAPARALRSAVCSASALGAAFLVLEHVDVSYLESLGL